MPLAIGIEFLLTLSPHLETCLTPRLLHRSNVTFAEQCFPAVDWNASRDLDGQDIISVKVRALEPLASYYQEVIYGRIDVTACAFVWEIDEMLEFAYFSGAQSQLVTQQGSCSRVLVVPADP